MGFNKLTGKNDFSLSPRALVQILRRLSVISGAKMIFYPHVMQSVQADAVFSRENIAHSE